MRKIILPLLAGLSLSAMATSANAATFLFDSVGDSQVIDFNGYDGNPANVVSGLTAQISYELANISVDGKTYTFNVSVNNTSSGATTASRISGFGFDVDPNVPSGGVLALPGSAFQIESSGNVPSGFGNVEVCFLASGGGQCAGGGGGGVTLGNSGSGDFSLTFGSTLASGVTLSNLFVRYQAIDNQAAGLKDGSGVGQPISAVPEPATWAMMIVGFGMVGASIRRSRRKVSAVTA